MRGKSVDRLLVVALGCAIIAAAIIFAGTRRVDAKRLAPNRLDPESGRVYEQRIKATEDLLEGDALSADPL